MLRRQSFRYVKHSLYCVTDLQTHLIWIQFTEGFSLKVTAATESMQQLQGTDLFAPVNINP